MFFLASIALAAVPIVLPAGEDEATWAAALELADLEWADHARLSVQAAAGGWVISADVGDGSTRSLRVERPTTAAGREEVAFLARGMARELAMVRDARRFGPTAVPSDPEPPGPLPKGLTARPLPVLPPRTPHRPAPQPDEPVTPPVVAPDPGPSPVTPDPVTPDPVTPDPVVVPEPVQPPGGVEPPVEPDGPVESDTDAAPDADTDVAAPTELDDPVPVVSARYWDLRVAYPPLFVFGGVRARSDRDVGGLLGLGIRGVETRSFTVDLTAGYNTPQTLHLPNGSGLWRTEDGLQCELRPGVRITPEVGVSLMVGLEHRVYRQEFNVIDAATVPVMGGALQVDGFPAQRVTPFVRLAVDVDGGTTKFLDEFRRVSTVSRVEGTLAVGVRMSTRRDPNARMETPSP